MAVVRGLVRTVALAVVLAGLAGCTEDEPAPPPPPASTPTAAPSPDEVTLQMSVFGNDDVVAAYQEVADAFMAESPEVSVVLEAQPDADVAAQEVRASLEAGDGPDVFLLHEDWLPQFVQEGRLQPLDLLLEDRGLQFGDDFQRVALTAFSANSGLQCMPAEMSPLVVYYNKRLVPRRGLLAQGIALPDGPERDTWSWEDFTATARAAASGTPGSPRSPVHGVYLPAQVELLTAFLRSGGADVVDDVLDPTSLTLASDEAVETLQLVAGLTRDATVTPTREQDAAGDPLTAFLEGRLAMYVGTRADLPAMRRTDGLRFDVFPLPSVDRARSVATTTGLCVDATSPAVEEAADLVAFAVGEEGASILAESGAVVPSRLDTVVEEVFTQPDQAPRAAHVFASSLRRSDLLPYATAWPEVADRVETLLRRIWFAPGFDLDERLVPALERLDERSQRWFDPDFEVEAPEDETTD